MCMKRIVLVTGGFDPLHSGHIEYFKAAKQLGDILVVGINSDDWLARKKGRAFMPFDERMNIVKNIQGVDFVIEFNDNDGSATLAIKLVKQTWPNDKIIFANGGDRTKENIPEMIYDDVEYNDDHEYCDDDDNDWNYDFDVDYHDYDYDDYNDYHDDDDDYGYVF